MYRIYFDTNDIDREGRHALNLVGSLRDIGPIAHALKDGMRVVIYMTGELEMDAILEFDRGAGYWTARPVEGTTRYLDGSDGTRPHG